MTTRFSHGQPVDFDGWPPSRRPEVSDVFAHNEIISPIPPERLWAWLVRARGWPRWYANCRRLRIETRGRQLQMGTTFRWMTFGTTITSTVDLFEPHKALGWSWYGSTAQGYHVWLLEPYDGGSRIVTEESQTGLGPHWAPCILAPMTRAGHALWLRSLSTRGQKPPPKDD